MSCFPLLFLFCFVFFTFFSPLTLFWIKGWGVMRKVIMTQIVIKIILSVKGGVQSLPRTSWFFPLDFKHENVIFTLISSWMEFMALQSEQYVSCSILKRDSKQVLFKGYVMGSNSNYPKGLECMNQVHKCLRESSSQLSHRTRGRGKKSNKFQSDKQPGWRTRVVGEEEIEDRRS